MRTGPSDTFIAHKAISLSEKLTGTEKRVGAVVVDHYNRKTGQCDPSLGSIARLLGVSRRTVIRAINALVRNGYIRKIRHGGKYHRNSYQPMWSRFRADDTKWNDSRTPARRFVAAELSPLQRQERHLDGDTDGTQTCSNNHLKQNLPAERPANELRAPNEPNAPKRLSKDDNRNATYGIGYERFHVKSTSAHVAAHDAAERRWNEQFTRQLVAAPEVFGHLVELIDADLSKATTEAELKKPGSGIFFLMSKLDRRHPLSSRRSFASCDKATLVSPDSSATEVLTATSECPSEDAALGQGGIKTLKG